jgi:hypothetical protein
MMPASLSNGHLAGMEAEIQAKLWRLPDDDPLRPQLENALALIRGRMALQREQQPGLRKMSR